MLDYEQIRSLHIEASSHCNASCAVCSRNYHGGITYPWLNKTYLTLDQHKRFFPEELAKQLRSLNYCGNLGDPTLNPELVEICSWWFSCNPKMAIQINTNAGTQNATFWRALGKLFKDTYCNVTFSVDGLEDTNHLYRRGVKWQKIRVAMDAYIGAGGPAVWEFLVFRHNQHQVEAARKLAAEIGFQKFFPKKAMGFAQGSQSYAISVVNKKGNLEYNIFPPDQHVNEAFLATGKKASIQVNFPNPETIWRRELRPLFELKLDPDYEVKLDMCEIECTAKKERQLFVSSEGLLFPCCFIGSRYYSPTDGQFVNKQIQMHLDSQGEKNFSLHHRSFKAIVEEPWFRDGFEKTWRLPKVREGKLAICGEFCAKGITEMKSATAHRRNPEPEV